MTPEIEKLPYRPCAGIMLLNKVGEVFVARRIDSRAEAWQMPQGGIDDGEPPHEAAIRELHEETGIKNVEVLRESRRWLSYDLPEHLVPRLWNGQYRGQTQKWFLLKFQGDDAEINIETKHPEFCDWKWVHHSVLPEIIVPFKRALYESLLDEFDDVLRHYR